MMGPDFALHAAARSLMILIVVVLAIGVSMGVGGMWLWENFPTITIEWTNQ